MRFAKRARELRKSIEKTTQTLTDEEALKVVELHPAWTADNAAYTAGEKVRYEGALYKCLQDHTSQETWTPTDAPSLWAKVLIPDPGFIPEWEQPGSTNPYMKGDKVKHNGKTWESTVDNNVWEPGVYGWDEIK
jgi:chitodextrinase